MKLKNANKMQQKEIQKLRTLMKELIKTNGYNSKKPSK